MSFEKELNKLYQQIAQHVNDMIPIKWTNFYFNGEVKDVDGGVFFFFTPKGDNEEAIYSHYIPKLYNLEKRLYAKALHELFVLTVQLQKVFIDHDQDPWFSVTLIVDEERKLKVNYDYIDWSETEFGPSVRLKYFQYKYLNKLPKDEKELFEKMNEYEKNKK